MPQILTVLFYDEMQPALASTNYIWILGTAQSILTSYCHFVIVMPWQCLSVGKLCLILIPAYITTQHYNKKLSLKEYGDKFLF